MSAERTQCKKKHNTYILVIFSLFILFSFLTRAVTLNYHGILSFDQLFTPVISDIAISLSAFFLLSIIAKIGRIACLGLLIFWPVVNFASIESILALNKPLSISDLHYTTNGGFLENTLQALAYPIPYAILLAIFIAFSAISKPLKSINIYLSIILFTASISATYFSSNRVTNWLQANPLALTVINYYNTNKNQKLLSEIKNKNLDNGIKNPLLKNETTTTTLEENKKNVLLIVLEGIPGAYINSIQDYFDIPRNNIMPNLSKIAKNSQTTPSFVTHSQQTIRGLYSMLCGDYSKQSVTAPKSLEYLQIDVNNRRKCLPEILTDEGYNTAYLQAADLSFMSKDQFMPAIGFQQVNGKSWFKDQYIKFGWGPDDKAFLEQTGTKIQQLEDLKKPWFLTLLTVGTHHPYGVSDNFAKGYTNRKEASVAYLDQAIPALMKQLADMDLLDSTLIVFTSDESHGVKGHPYGNNWGLNIMTGPGITPGMKPGLYGLSDTSLTILDYLGLSDKGNHLTGRSLLQNYPINRELSFHSTMGFQYQALGSVNGCNSSGNCFKFTPDNNKLFSPNYQKEEFTDNLNKKVWNSIKIAALQLDQSLVDDRNDIKEWHLIKNKLFQATHNYTSLSSGSFINIPKSSKVMITLKGKAQEKSSNNRISLSLNSKGFIGEEKYNQEISLNKIILPTLSGSDQLNLQYSFYSAEGITHFSPDLHSHLNGDIFIDLFSVKIEQSDTPSSFTVQSSYLIKDGISNLFQQNSDDSFSIPVHYKIGENIHFSASNIGSQMLNKGWSFPENWGVWSDAKKAGLSFYLDKEQLLAPDDNYQIKMKASAYINDKKTTLSGTILLNGQVLGSFNYLYPDNKKTLTYTIPLGLLKKKNTLTVAFSETLESPKNLGLGDDPRLLGLGLESIKIESKNMFRRMTSLLQ